MNDWGGVSPVTPDHVNPEAPWPHLEDLARDTAASGKLLVERLGIYPPFAGDANRWLEPGLRASVLDTIDADGLARTDRWHPGAASLCLPELPTTPGFIADRNLDHILHRADDGEDLAIDEVERLLAARDGELHQITAAADTLRQRICGDTVSYVVTRNINYTNICYFKCRFCAFSKGKTSENLRGRPYDLELDEITRRAREAWDRGAVEVCLQGGIHPNYTGQTYLDILKAIKAEVPDLHVHAFSPLEIHQGAETSGIPIAEFLGQLIEAGLGSLPGTAAEILDDEVRALLCPDKIDTSQWFEVVDTAHRLGLKTTATIMFGHIDRPRNWARHLIRLRDQQKKTGGFSEGSVSEVYAWAADCCGEAGPRRCPPDHADEMEPSQIAVQVLRGDAAIAAQETLQLAVAAIDRLNVEGIPDPLSGRKVQGFVANAHGRSAGRIAAMTVRNQNDVGIQNRFEHRLQGLGVDRRKNLADGCAAAIGGDQDRHLFIRQAALAGLAATLARLAIQSARSLVALKHVSLVNFDNALEFRPILACGLQETVPPAEGRIDAKSASTGRFPYRLALGQRHAE